MDRKFLCKKNLNLNFLAVWGLATKVNKIAGVSYRQTCKDVYRAHQQARTQRTTQTYVLTHPRHKVHTRILTLPQSPSHPDVCKCPDTLGHENILPPTQC